jgi:hypothetical protein
LAQVPSAFQHSVLGGVLQTTGVPAQVPFPSQTSFVVQGSPSLQGVFFAFGV